LAFFLHNNLQYLNYPINVREQMDLTKKTLSAEEFHQLGDLVPHITWFIDLINNSYHYNQKWFDYIGDEHSREPNWASLIHPDDYLKCMEIWAQTDAQGIPWEVAYRLKRHDGKYRWHLGKSVSFRNKEGQLICRFGTATDIDNLKRIEEDQRFMAEASDILSSSLDKEDILLKVSALATKRFGGACLIHQRVNGKIIPVTSNQIAGIGISFSEEFFKSVEEGAIQTQLSHDPLFCCPLRNERETIGFITFLSKQEFDEQGYYLARELARRISLYIDNLNLFDDQVKGRFQVEKLVGKLQKAIDSRDIFLGICSHELKTPVTSLKLLSQITLRQLERDQYLLDKGNVTLNVQKFSKQIDRLAHLIEAMLDVSRIDSGRLIFRKDSLNLYDFAHEIKDKFSLHFRELNIPFTIAFENDISVMADQTRLEQVLVNVLSNAIKYGNKSPVHFSLEKHEDSAVFKIKDGGQGISANHLRSIFNRFERVNVDSNVTGLGLGLFISKTIIDAHDGEIKVESELGKGTLFSIHLPLN
jgi:signal transduction histidine kinase